MLKKEEICEVYECCQNPYNRHCDDCPVTDDCLHDNVPICVLGCAVTLLKEQQAVIEQLRNDANARRCKDCGHRFDGEHYPNCCEVMMGKTGWIVEIPVSDDWYCADFYPSDEAVSEDG